MLDVAPTELLLVAVVAVIVIGPKDLPKAMRVAGYWVGKMRGVARQFRQGFDDMVRESEFAEMEKKWAEENARIMREFPSADTPPAVPPVPEPVAALPAPGQAPAPAPTPTDQADAVAADPGPVMTVEPMLFDDPAVAEPPPVDAASVAPPARPKRKRKVQP